MKVYVINLERSSNRRKAIEARLKTLGMEWKIVRAFDASQVSEEDIQQRCLPQAYPELRKWLTPGLIGAAISHHEARCEILKDGVASACIVEDDALLGDSFPSVLANLERCMRLSEVSLLYYSSITPCKLSGTSSDNLGNGHSLLYPIDYLHLSGAVAYAITAQACEAMAERQYPIRQGSDTWRTVVDEGIVHTLRVVYPMPVSTGEYASTVGYLRNPLWRGIAHFIQQFRIPPFYQIIHARRGRALNRVTQFKVVSIPSRLVNQSHPHQEN